MEGGGPWRCDGVGRGLVGAVMLRPNDADSVGTLGGAGRGGGTFLSSVDAARCTGGVGRGGGFFGGVPWLLLGGGGLVGAARKVVSFRLLERFVSALACRDHKEERANGL